MSDGTVVKCMWDGEFSWQGDSANWASVQLIERASGDNILWRAIRNRNGDNGLMSRFWSATAQRRSSSCEIPEQGQSKSLPHKAS